MDKSRSSRRRLIRVGAIGFATSIAGCSGYLNERDDYNRDPPDERNNDTETDAPKNERPEDPPATFESTYGDFTYHDLFVHRELPDPSDLGKMGAHFDNSMMRVEILDADTAKATLDNTNVTRDITLTLHIRDADRRWRNTETPLPATDTDTHETREAEFDLSGITLPTGAGSICVLTGTDTHPGDDYEMVLKTHQFVGIPYKNGVNWVNNENFNYTRWMGDDGIPKKSAPRGVRGNKRAEPAGHVETIDTDDERIVFIASRTPANDEVFGVSAHIKHKPAQDYKNGSNTYKYRYGPKYEAHFATEISHFRELAEKLDQAITGIGITQSRQRLEVLGDLIQMIPYIPQNLDPSPTVVLYDILGDCSSKSVLMSCILQNDPWNIMPAYIDCDINGVGHWTIGLDVNDLSGDPGFTVATTAEQVNDGYPDTEYAFFDMTYDSTIGERTSGVEDEIIYDLGDFTHEPSRRANDPPNY